MITTGNIVNSELFRLFQNNFNTIQDLFKKGNKIIGINNASIIVHR